MQASGFIALELGRFTVKGKEHIWARYNVGNGCWTKKYLIVLNRIEYATTATCLDERLLLQMEKVWDAIVNSFRIRPTPLDLSKVMQTLAQPARLSDMPERIEPV